MKILFTFIIGFLISSPTTFAQYGNQEIPRVDTFYFPFHNGTQMIEINHLAYYQMLDLRYSMMDQMPYYLDERPVANEYFFRDKSGNITKSFNSSLNYDSLELSLKDVSFVNMRHNQERLTLDNIWYSYPGMKMEITYPICNYTLQTYDYQDTSVVKNLRYGLIDTLGNIIFPAEFEDIQQLKNNCFVVSKNQKYGVVTRDQKTLVPMEYARPGDTYRDYIFFGYSVYDFKICFHVPSQKALRIPENSHQLFHETPTLFITQSDSLFGVMNIRTDKQIIPNKFDRIDIFSYYGEQDDLAILVKKDNKFGFFSLDGKVILPCIYDKIHFWEDQNGQFVMKVEKNGIVTEIIANQ